MTVASRGTSPTSRPSSVLAGASSSGISPAGSEIRASREPFVHQFVNGELDGPVPFHYAAPAYAAELDLAGA